MRRSSAPLNSRRRKPNKAPKKRALKKHEAEVSEHYLSVVAGLEKAIPVDTRQAKKYRERNEERARNRSRELRRGERMQNGDKWGNTWYRRHRFLENIIERSERDIRQKRMLLGWRHVGGLRLDNLAAVRSAMWPSVAMWTSYLVGSYRLENFMRSSPAGSDPKP